MRSSLKDYIKILALLTSERQSRAKFDYISQGYDTGATARENEIALKNQVLSSEENTTESCRVSWGQLSCQVMVAPMAFHSLFDEENGEVATARACEKTGVPFIVPMMSNYSLEEIAASAPRATLLQQMHICEDLTVNQELISRAKKNRL